MREPARQCSLSVLHNVVSHGGGGDKRQRREVSIVGLRDNKVAVPALLAPHHVRRTSSVSVHGRCRVGPSCQTSFLPSITRCAADSRCFSLLDQYYVCTQKHTSTLTLIPPISYRDPVRLNSRTYSPLPCATHHLEFVFLPCPGGLSTTAPSREYLSRGSLR